MEKTCTELGSLIEGELKSVLENAAKFRDLAGDGTYQAFLHGQAAGLAVALKIMFPGDGELGERAATLLATALGENKCACQDHGHDHGHDHSRDPEEGYAGR